MKTQVRVGPAEIDRKLRQKPLSKEIGADNVFSVDKWP